MKTNTSVVEILEARIAPATFTVTTIDDTTNVAHDTGSLRDALALADADPATHDTIKFDFDLPPPLNGAQIIKLTSGELTSLGKVTIKGPGAGKLIIDGNDASRVLKFNNGNNNVDSPVSLKGLSIVNGKADGQVGGGIFSSESLTLKNVVISSNSAIGGAGVFVGGNSAAGTEVNISKSLITGNNTGGYGGGLQLVELSSLTISKTVVSGNRATGNSGGGIYAAIHSAGTGIAITDCVISGNSASYGGGLFLKDENTAPTSKITISGTKITGNASNNTGDSGGGGLLLAKGNAVITGSTIRGNTAVANGGGIYAGPGFTSLTISKSIISGNRTTTPGAVQYHGGGGIVITGVGSTTLQPVTITKSVISDNQSATYGGGLLAKGGIALTISKSTLSGNHASEEGGGIYVAGYDVVGGTNKVDLIVKGGVISDNTSKVAGGVSAIGDGATTISSAKITGNIATEGNGGGIYGLSNAAVLLKKLTVSGNFAASDGGGVRFNGTADLTVTGGSFSNNAALHGGAIGLKDSGGSITGAAMSGNAAAEEGGGVFNGGNTPGSLNLQVAKVTGNTAPTDPNISGTNITRSGPEALAPAAGSGTFVVNTVDDVAADDGVLSLREALAAADLTPDTVDTIGFALPALDFVDGAWIIKLNGTALTSQGNVTIKGPGAGKLILDGDNASRIFNFDDIGSTDRPVSIKGLSIVHGNAGVDEGGGITSQESLTLKNVVVSGNVAQAGAGLFMDHAGTKTNVGNSFFTGNDAAGAAAGLDFIHLESVTISKSIVTGNTVGSTAGGGGGIYAYVDAFNGSTGVITIADCFISGNDAAYAGGLYVKNTDIASKTTISSTAVTGNVSHATSGILQGGALFVTQGNTTITGSTIRNNTAVYHGGGIYAGQGFSSLTISKSTISGNRTTATNAAGQGGGGLFINGNGTAAPKSVNISKSVIADNRSALDGGGVKATGGVALALSACTLAGNHAGSNGGSVFANGDLLNKVDLTIKGGTFADNTASNGGGIYIIGTGTLSLTASKVTGNAALGNFGGGIYARTTGPVTLKDAVITGNLSKQFGGGLLVYQTPEFTVNGGSITGNSATDSGGGIYAGYSSGSITGVTVSGNVAGIQAGGVDHAGTGTIILEIAKVIANTAPLGPNVIGTFA